MIVHPDPDDTRNLVDVICYVIIATGDCTVDGNEVVGGDLNALQVGGGERLRHKGEYRDGWQPCRRGGDVLAWVPVSVSAVR